jgi:MFS family permease
LRVSHWRSRLAESLPFYYGWVIIANTVAISLSSRTIMTVAVLSVFVVPMTEELGWSRGLFSGAVSLGGLCAVVVSPFIGRWVDRYGAGTLLAVSSFLTGALSVLLAMITSPLAFYALYVPGRMIFTGPLELGIPTALSNWFIRRRPLSLAVDGAAKGLGLTIMPLVAQFLITGWDWKTAWIALGVLSFCVGIVPPLIFIARRPEDMGIEPDPLPKDKRDGQPDTGEGSPGTAQPEAESDFTVSQALRTRALWILAVFSGAGFMVQAGVSLHQVPHYIEQGILPYYAALTASGFALAQIVAGIFWSTLSRRVPLRFLLAAAAFVLALASQATSYSDTPAAALGSAAAVGLGVGGLHLLVRLAWADYYGRRHLGSIRGITMSAQIGGQALGPVTSGFLFDHTGNYHLALQVFTAAATLGGLLVLLATPPKLHAQTPVSDPV